MASIRAIHDAKHHRDVISSLPPHVGDAIEKLLSAFTAIQDDMTAAMASNTFLEASIAVELLERLSSHVEDLASSLATSPRGAASKQKKPLRSPRAGPGEGSPPKPPLSFIANGSNSNTGLSISGETSCLPMPAFDNGSFNGTDSFRKTVTGHGNTAGPPHRVNSHSFNSHHRPAAADTNDSVGGDSCHSLMSQSLQIQPSLRHGEDEAGFATLNSYVVITEIGDGTTAKVLQVCDTVTSQMFAIKRVQRNASGRSKTAMPTVGGSATSSCVNNKTSGTTTFEMANISFDRNPIQKALAHSASFANLRGNNNNGLVGVAAPGVGAGLRELSSDGSNAGGQTSSFLDSTSSHPNSVSPAVHALEQSNYNFRKEIAIMKKLQHPNLVKLHEVIDDHTSDEVFLVMDFVQGGPLLELNMDQNTVTAPEEPYTDQVVKAQFKCIANALKYLHRHRIAHLDIKPENILLNEHGDPIIIDFGVAHQKRGRNTLGDPSSPTKFGTPAFFSPEQCEGLPADQMDLFAADIWALGITLYTMLFRKLPFHATSYHALRQSIISDQLLFPKDCDKDVRNLLTSMLCKDPEFRLDIFDVCRHPYLKRSSRRPGNLPGGRQRTSSVGNKSKSGSVNSTTVIGGAVGRLSIGANVSPPFKPQMSQSPPEKPQQHNNNSKPPLASSGALPLSPMAGNCSFASIASTAAGRQNNSSTSNKPLKHVNTAIFDDNTVYQGANGEEMLDGAELKLSFAGVGGALPNTSLAGAGGQRLSNVSFNNVALSNLSFTSMKGVAPVHSPANGLAPVSNNSIALPPALALHSESGDKTYGEVDEDEDDGGRDVLDLSEREIANAVHVAVVKLEGSSNSDVAP